MSRLALCALVLFSGLGGCGDDVPREADPGETRPPALQAPELITEEDAGSSFRLAPGSETILRLSDGYLWSEPQAPGGAVELVRVDYFQDPGFSEWVVRAVRPGTATIAATGRPACAGEEDCPEEPARFELTITVAG